jgi:hypothetical protein
MDDLHPGMAMLAISTNVPFTCYGLQGFAMYNLRQYAEAVRCCRLLFES